MEGALRWLAAQGSDGPQREDVELVVRLDVTSIDVARKMLWLDSTSLIAQWDGLMHAVDHGLEDEPEPRLGAAPVPTATEPPNVAQPEDGDSSSPDALKGAALARYRALVRFVAERREAGEDVSGVSDENLRQAAESERPVFKRFGPFLRSHANDLLTMLAAATADFNETGPEVAEASQQEDGAPIQERSGPAEPTDFCRWVYAVQTEVRRSPASVTFSVSEGGELVVAWPPPPADNQVRVFRVVTHDDYLPDMSPELGELLAATYDCSITDSRAHLTAVRHVAVWMHSGTTERGARDSQPSLYAAGSCVLPVRNCVIREDEGTVVGQWHVADGIDRVAVLRLPANVAASQGHYNPNYSLPAECVVLGGFTDETAQPGQAYEYRVYAFADVREVATPSPYVAVGVRIKATLHQVNDLAVSLQEGSEDLYDLTWSKPPLGKVEIYRSESPPASGIDADVRDRSALVRQGLTPELLLTRQLESADGRESMRGVPWPHGWTRAYFTAATVLSDDEIQVGNVVILNRSNTVEHIRLIERVDEQFLTFAWPVGAAQVRVYIGPKGSDLVSPELQTPLQEIFENECTRQGGAHLGSPLPAEGCAVHIVAVSFALGQATFSASRSIEYPGLLRIGYEIGRVEQAKGLRARNQRVSRLRVTATAAAQADNLTLVLTHHPHRLPLHGSDGHEVARRVVSMAPGAPVIVADDLDLADKGGFIRLFAEIPQEMAHLVAILDPPVSQLLLVRP